MSDKVFWTFTSLDHSWNANQAWPQTFTGMRSGQSGVPTCADRLHPVYCAKLL